MRTVPLSIPASLKPGTYYIYINVNPNDSGTDNDMSNNLIRVKVLVSDKGVNDFYITDLTLEKDTFQIGEPITVDFNIHYNGNNQSMFDCDYMVALSNDIFGESYQYSGYRDFALLSRDSSVIHVSGTLQTDYCDQNTDVYIRVKADYSEQFDEADEGNNITAQKINISNYPSLDISISNFELTTDSICHNSKLYCSYDIEYGGDALYDFNVPVRIVLSSNNVFSDNDDITLSQQNINFGQGTEGVKKTIQVNDLILNRFIQAGDYYLFVAASPLLVSDPNTDNNMLSKPITLLEQSKGDFSISDLYFEADTAYLNNYVVLEFTVHKENEFYTFDRDYIRVCFSADTIWGNSDDIPAYLLYNNSELIEDSLQKTEVSQLIISANTVPGNYYVIIKIDAYNQFNEQDESNNTVYRPIIIKDPANDFYVTNFNVQSNNDDLFTISGVLKNEGHNHNFLIPHITFYISVNDKLNDADDFHNFMLPWNSLSDSTLGTFSFNYDLSSWVSEGEYYLILEIADYYYYYDTDVTNNISVTSFEIGCNSQIVHEFVDLCGDESYLGWSTEGDYERILQSEDGCDSIVYTHIRTFSNPEKPTFSFENDCLYSSSSEWNQWYFEQSEINGANDSVYCINQNGNYAVRLIDEFGCKSEISDYIYINFSSIIDLDTDIVVYPNPTKGMLYISGLSNSTSTIITIYNLNGKRVKQEIISTEDRLIDITDQPNGVYFIKFNNEMCNVIKIIKN